MTFSSKTQLSSDKRYLLYSIPKFYSQGTAKLFRETTLYQNLSPKQIENVENILTCLERQSIINTDE